MSSLRVNRRLAVFGLGAALALSGGCTTTIGTTQVKGQIIAQSALEQIPIGSSQEQVLVVLGTPSTTEIVSGQVFYYISTTERRAVRFMKASVTDQRVVAIYFDQDRRVSRVADYGMKDGVVFDFISRKTPTSGVEKSLLQQMFGIIAF